MDLSQVTLTQIRYAIAVAEAKNFRQAAERSHVSQPALSMQVQKLEEMLGVVLFDRSKKPVLITQEGARALEQMRSILRETERLAQVIVDDDTPRGPYRLGVIPTLSPTVLPLFLAKFLERCPLVELSIEELQTHEIIDRLGADSLDAGIAATPLHVAGLEETVLGQERFSAYLPPHDPLLKKKTLRQSDLTERPLWVMPEGHCFRTQVLSYCAGKGRDARAKTEFPAGLRFESASFETLVRLVDAGLGATVLPDLVARDLPKARRIAQLRPLEAPVPLREIGLVTSRSQLRRRVTDALVDEIQSALSEVLDDVGRGKRVVLDPLAE
mgnify:FL=1